MNTNCIFCDTNFSTKGNLIKHLKNEKCQEFKNLKPLDVYSKCINFCINQNHSQSHNNHSLNTNSYNTTHNTINIHITPINEIKIDYINESKMKDLIIKYNETNLRTLISEYIRLIICDKNHPENHCIRYLQKRPILYVFTMNVDGSLQTFRRTVKETCELIADTILILIKTKLRECVKHYKKLNDDIIDMHSDKITDIKKTLNSDVVKKALKTVLNNDIINNIEMRTKL